MEIKEFEHVLGETETLLDRLRALYEQYFQGVERLEPAVPRKELDRRLASLRREVPRNTALRFRFNSLVQKYVTYQTYWGRIARQIEEGTYRRDVLRARKQRIDAREARRKEREEPQVFEVDIEVDGGDGLFGDQDVDAALEAFKPQSLPPAPGRLSTRPMSFSPFAKGAKGSAPRRARARS